MTLSVASSVIFGGWHIISYEHTHAYTSNNEL